MIHLTYFRYLREDEINLAPEVSIYFSLSVENLPHCKYLKLNAVNPPLCAKTNYPEKSYATICFCFQPTLHVYSHCESLKLYINILNFYSCMRPGTHLSWRLELWIWRWISLHVRVLLKSRKMEQLLCCWHNFKAHSYVCIQHLYLCVTPPQVMRPYS